MGLSEGSEEGGSGVGSVGVSGVGVGVVSMGSSVEPGVGSAEAPGVGSALSVGPGDTLGPVVASGEVEGLKEASGDTLDRKSTRLNSSHRLTSRMPSSA